MNANQPDREPATSCESAESAPRCAEERQLTPPGSFASSLGLDRNKGQRYHEHPVDRLSELLEWLRHYDGPIGRRA